MSAACIFLISLWCAVSKTAPSDAKQPPLRQFINEEPVPCCTVRVWWEVVPSWNLFIILFSQGTSTHASGGILVPKLAFGRPKLWRHYTVSMATEPEFILFGTTIKKKGREKMPGMRVNWCLGPDPFHQYITLNPNSEHVHPSTMILLEGGRTCRL